MSHFCAIFLREQIVVSAYTVRKTADRRSVLDLQTVVVSHHNHLRTGFVGRNTSMMSTTTVQSGCDGRSWRLRFRITGSSKQDISGRCSFWLVAACPAQKPSARISAAIARPSHLRDRRTQRHVANRISFNVPSFHLMPSELRVLNERLLRVLGTQPHVGFSAFGRDGRILFCNPTARRLFYGFENFDPVGLSVSDIEGDEFSAELLPIIERCCSTQQPIMIDHIRFGKRITSIGWPVRKSTSTPANHSDALVASTVLARTTPADQMLPGGERLESSIASWGMLETLTDRELEVLAEIGRGLSQQEIARELGITRKTVETHRARIGQKLRAKSSTELARIACESGLRRRDVKLSRQRQQEWMSAAQSALAAGESEAEDVRNGSQVNGTHSTL